MATGPHLRAQKFNQLMLKRVREVLLVSTPYDAFVLQEDGNLTEQIFLEYKELSLSSAPHVTHVTTEQAALEALARDRFDLVLRVARLADTDLADFARQVKAVRAQTPVVVLGFDDLEMARLRPLIGPETIDSVFLWNGDAKILLAIIKDFEDRANLDRDIALADIRALLVVEDSIRYYSSFLSVLYPELMKQSQSLFAEGKNRLDKLLRMRTRPKIIHAVSFEQAIGFFDRYRDNIIGIITDVDFPSGGTENKQAGLELVERVRAEIPDLPILMQSANESYARRAQALGAQFVNKNSSALHKRVRRFLAEFLGFGAFVFRLPSGEEVGRARDVQELTERVRTVPDASLEFHARRNHISNWLMARSEFDLAAKLRPKKVVDYPTLAELRSDLLRELQALRREASAGAITDFSAQNFDPDSLFQRIGDGSLGGKARGLAYLHMLFSTAAEHGALAGLQVQIPQTFALATDAFDRFLEENALHQAALTATDDREVASRFLAARLPEAVLANLKVIIAQVAGPLAVRSSSLLEDDMLHPFAGIYGTVMIPNNDPDPAVRLQQLCHAIQWVYATTFFQNAKTYIQNTAKRAEEEKMAVVIQRMVGQRFDGRFYPHFSGVAHSYNYYPLPPLQANDGVVEVALGLGRIVVDGGECLRFCPKYPAVVPQFATPKMVMESSQRSFYALDLTAPFDLTSADSSDCARRYDLEDARTDGTLACVGSVVDHENDTITESPQAAGPWVVTFNNILKHQLLPLAPALDALLQLTTQAVGTAVEIEFACDIGDQGALRAADKPGRPAVLYALQFRPILARERMTDLRTEAFPEDRLICRTNRALGHGCYTNLSDVVYVKGEGFNPGQSPLIARQVGQLNQRLAAEGRSYILIGPGRWGSSDHWLGIPVQWSQISAARIIIEASPAGYHVDPSQGTHFFHNLTSLRLGYLTIPPGATPEDNPEEFVDWKWLGAQPALFENEYLRHVRAAEPLQVVLDGRKGTGVIARPDGKAVPPERCEDR